MSEWWTYRLSDFILFSPDTYYRTFALYHHRIWPMQVAVVLLLFLAAAAARRTKADPAARGRQLALVLAAAWGFCSGGFLLGAYASINWAARYFAAGFAVQSLLLLWLGFRGRIQLDVNGSRLAPWLIAAIGISAALAGMLAGRSWDQVEFVGLTPDPTAVATIALLGLSVPTRPRVALLIPVAWCLVGGLTLWALGSRESLWTWASAGVALSVPMVTRKHIHGRNAA